MERDFGMKSGGGKMVLKSPTLKYLEWNPVVNNQEWLSSEQIWILVHKHGIVIDIC